MRSLFLLILFCLTTVCTLAQTETAVPEEVVPEAVDEFQTEETSELDEAVEPVVMDLAPAPPPTPVSMRNIEDSHWSKSSGHLDYSKDIPAPPKAEKAAPKVPDANWLGAFDGLGTILQVLAIIFAIALIGWGVWRMMDQPANRKIATDGVVINAENLDAYLHETDLDVFLREALQAQDFKLAIRIRYLQAIKHLTDRGKIQWAKEKTNREYVREMRPHAQGEAFKQATQVYERAWYGNRPLRATEFAVIEPLFTGLIAV